jgi:hypothetical protein
MEVVRVYHVTPLFSIVLWATCVTVSLVCKEFIVTYLFVCVFLVAAATRVSATLFSHVVRR